MCPSAALQHAKVSLNKTLTPRLISVIYFRQERQLNTLNDLLLFYHLYRSDFCLLLSNAKET